MTRFPRTLLHIAYRLAFAALNVGGFLAMTWTRWRTEPLQKPPSGGEEKMRKNQNTHQSSTHSTVASRIVARPQLCKVKRSTV
jgi:hypothetical protein